MLAALTWLVAWCGQLVESSVLIFFHGAVCVSVLQFFFSREVEHCCFAICPVIRLVSSVSVVIEVVSVRSERNFLCARFQISPYGWSLWQLVPPPLDVVGVTWSFLLLYLGYFFDQGNEKQNHRSSSPRIEVLKKPEIRLSNMDKRSNQCVK